MRLAYKFNIGNNENISSLCKISNNLYNQALYIFRETLSKEDKWLSYFELDSIMKNTKNLDGWVIYDLRPLEDGCIMYYGEDERISIFYNNRLIKFVGYQGEYNIGDSIKIVKVK